MLICKTNGYFFDRYNAWACTQCRKACITVFGDTDETKDPFEWLYDEMTIHTPSTAGSFFPQHGSDYEPADIDMSPSQREKGKKEFKQWLASTDYQGRWRSTENYCALSKHDQTTFRSQMKGIFHHILHQLASNDVDTVWDDLIDAETRKPTKTKSGYDIPYTTIHFPDAHHVKCYFFSFFRDYDVVMKALKDAYARAEHWSTKRQLLSIVAADLPTHLLKAEFPELTDWKIKAARAQAYFHGNV